MRDWIALSIALAIDGVQDAYDTVKESSDAGTELPESPDGGRDLEEIVEKLNAFYRPPVENGKTLAGALR